jgi:hypothetical protein
VSNLRKWDHAQPISRVTSMIRIVENVKNSFTVGVKATKIISLRKKIAKILVLTFVICQQRPDHAEHTSNVTRLTDTVEHANNSYMVAAMVMVTALPQKQPVRTVVVVLVMIAVVKEVMNSSKERI